MQRTATTTESTRSMTIKPFPDGLSHRLAFANWKYHVQAVAHDFHNNTKDNGGLLGHLLSPAAYEAKFRALGIVDFPYISIPNPVEPVGNNAIEWKRFERNLFLRQTEQSACRNFRHALLSALDSKTLNDIGTPLQRVDMTIQRIYNRVNELYGNVIGSELEVESQKLAVPLEALADFDHLLETHIAIHALADESRVPVSDFDKLKFLKAAIQHHEGFKLLIELFEAATDHHNGSRTWTTFKDAMVKAHCNMKVPSKSKKNQANNVTGSKHSREEEKDDEDPTNKEDSTPAMKKSTGGNSSAFSAEAFAKELFCHLANQIPGGAKPVTPKPQAPHYCWSHGYGNHPSKDCEKPKTGHIEDCAEPTKDNKGNTHVFRRFKK